MTRLLVITDPGKALDDEELLIVLATLIRSGEAELLGVVANLEPAMLRARLAKGTLKQLGLENIPVGAGSAIVSRSVQDENELSEVEYLADESEIEDGGQLLNRILEREADKSITLLLVSAMTDAASLLRSNRALFERKIAQVVIMGGVEEEEDEVRLDGAGLMVPDTATNNFYDRRAAAFLYREIQELRIPLTVLSRNATYATKVARSLYDDLRATGHPVGLKLRRSLELFIDDFWLAVNSAPDEPSHDGLPARWNRQLFLHTFCDDDGQDRDAHASVFDLVRHTTLADPMALLAAIPHLRDRFYEPAVVTIDGVEHRVIGISKNRTGVRNPAHLSEFLVSSLLAALNVRSPAPI